ncbi:hypothetical protein [Dyadobacter sp. 676]|uniref:Uncharacterized protein n=1 Tax=Dyadobacter sp. 676 TaxID=3088362 RepID=A0AAU8FI00_9BACT
MPASKAPAIGVTIKSHRQAQRQRNAQRCTADRIDDNGATVGV